MKYVTVLLVLCAITLSMKVQAGHLGACCVADFCSEIDENMCVKFGGEWQGIDTTCENRCGSVEMGACCMGDICFDSPV